MSKKFNRSYLKPDSTVFLTGRRFNRRLEDSVVNPTVFKRSSPDFSRDLTLAPLKYQWAPKFEESNPSDVVRLEGLGDRLRALVDPGVFLRELCSSKAAAVDSAGGDSEGLFQFFRNYGGMPIGLGPVGGRQPKDPSVPNTGFKDGWLSGYSLSKLNFGKFKLDLEDAGLVPDTALYDTPVGCVDLSLWSGRLFKKGGDLCYTPTPSEYERLMSAVGDLSGRVTSSADLKKLEAALPSFLSDFSDCSWDKKNVTILRPSSSSFSALEIEELLGSRFDQAVISFLSDSDIGNSTEIFKDALLAGAEEDASEEAVAKAECLKYKVFEACERGSNFLNSFGDLTFVMSLNFEGKAGESGKLVDCTITPQADVGLSSGSLGRLLPAFKAAEEALNAIKAPIVGEYFGLPLSGFGLVYGDVSAKQTLYFGFPSFASDAKSLEDWRAFSQKSLAEFFDFLRNSFNSDKPYFAFGDFQKFVFYSYLSVLDNMGYGSYPEDSKEFKMLSWCQDLLTFSGEKSKFALYFSLVASKIDEFESFFSEAINRAAEIKQIHQKVEKDLPKSCLISDPFWNPSRMHPDVHTRDYENQSRFSTLAVSTMPTPVKEHMALEFKTFSAMSRFLTGSSYRLTNWPKTADIPMDNLLDVLSQVPGGSPIIGYLRDVFTNLKKSGKDSIAKETCECLKFYFLKVLDFCRAGYLSRMDSGTLDLYLSPEISSKVFGKEYLDGLSGFLSAEKDEYSVPKLLFGEEQEYPDVEDFEIYNPYVHQGVGSYFGYDLAQARKLVYSWAHNPGITPGNGGYDPSEFCDFFDFVNKLKTDGVRYMSPIFNCSPADKQLIVSMIEHLRVKCSVADPFDGIMGFGSSSALAVNTSPVKVYPFSDRVIMRSASELSDYGKDLCRLVSLLAFTRGYSGEGLQVIPGFESLADGACSFDCVKSAVGISPTTRLDDVGLAHLKSAYLSAGVSYGFENSVVRDDSVFSDLERPSVSSKVNSFLMTLDSRFGSAVFDMYKSDVRDQKVLASFSGFADYLLATKAFEVKSDDFSEVASIDDDAFFDSLKKSADVSITKPLDLYTNYPVLFDVAFGKVVSQAVVDYKKTLSRGLLRDANRIAPDLSRKVPILDYTESFDLGSFSRAPVAKLNSMVTRSDANFLNYPSVLYGSKSLLSGVLKICKGSDLELERVVNLCAHLEPYIQKISSDKNLFKGLVVDFDKARLGGVGGLYYKLCFESFIGPRIKDFEYCPEPVVFGLSRLSFVDKELSDFSKALVQFGWSPYSMKSFDNNVRKQKLVEDVGISKSNSALMVP